jgi:hypothetical protein
VVVSTIHVLVGSGDTLPVGAQARPHLSVRTTSFTARPCIAYCTLHAAHIALKFTARQAALPFKSTIDTHLDNIVPAVTLPSHRSCLPSPAARPRRAIHIAWTRTSTKYRGLVTPPRRTSKTHRMTCRCLWSTSRTLRHQLWREK